MKEARGHFLFIDTVNKLEYEFRKMMRQRSKITLLIVLIRCICINKHNCELNVTFVAYKKKSNTCFYKHGEM